MWPTDIIKTDGAHAGIVDKRTTLCAASAGPPSNSGRNAEASRITVAGGRHAWVIIAFCSSRNGSRPADTSADTIRKSPSRAFVRAILSSVFKLAMASSKGSARLQGSNGFRGLQADQYAADVGRRPT